MNSNLRKLIGAIALSLIGYVVFFSFIIRQPLTTGLTNKYYFKKLAYAKGLKSPKIVLFAGSNGLFSHRCEVIAAVVGMPCVNASLHAGLSPDIALLGLKAFLNKGDLVLMPLEYSQYMQSDYQMEHNAGAYNYVVAYHKQWLSLLPAKRFIAALFSFDIRYLLSASTETLLSLLGVERRYTVATLTANGDMKGHTQEKGKEYRSFIASLPLPVPDGGYFAHHTFDGEKEVGKFLQWATRDGVSVIGMLPTVFDDRPVPPALIRKIQLLYENAGQEFIDLPNHSQYPRSHFYDTHYHLNEETQIQHSCAIAERLKPLIQRLSGYPDTLKK